MKTINNYISEKLIIDKNIKEVYQYFPASKRELKNIIMTIADDSKDGVVDLNNIDISNINIDSLEDLFLFDNKIKRLDVSRWDVSKIINMEYVFYDLTHLEYIDVTGWNVKRVASMSGMFSSNIQLKTIKGIEKWDVSNVADFSFMFEWCPKLTLDLSQWKFLENADTYHINHKSSNVKLNLT